MSRPLNQQVIVITGASSGIGRETAISAAKAGANVVLAARSDIALREAAAHINGLPGNSVRAIAIPTDVGDIEQVTSLARATLEQFGRIDTWVNAAAVGMYATVDQTTPEEMEQVLRVNVMGVFNGIKAVMPIFKSQRAGTLINIGSVLSEAAVPLQGAYVASKHAVKGLTDSLRLELQRSYPHIHVTLIMPASMNTPYFRRARSKIGVKPQPPLPVYQPSVAAEAVLFAAQHPRREILVGEGAQLMALIDRIEPRVLDAYMLQNDRMFKQQMTQMPAGQQDALFSPVEQSGTTKGEFESLIFPVTPARLLEYYPILKRLLPLSLLWGVTTLVRRLSR